MHGDFSRDTFDRRQRFSRVLMQQGRVLLDADWNEQTSILLHYIRALAADIIGPHGGPNGDGFRIGCAQEDGTGFECDFTIGYGRYYVDGILCENLPPATCGTAAGAEGGTATSGTAPPAPLRFTAQPFYPLSPDEEHHLEHPAKYLVYLDVWEQHVTHHQAGHIREVALGGPDTATRARVVWQVKAAALHKDTPDDLDCEALLEHLVEQPRSCLRARARVAEPSEDPCIVSPEARYRGAENQCYRVEIHDGGTAGATKQGATFKWSRDNGSVVCAIRELQGSIATLDTLGPDERRGLREDVWVEILDDHLALRGEHGVLARVAAIDRVAHRVTLAVPDGTQAPGYDDATATPILRRWDHGSVALPIQEGRWIDLEEGAQVWFESGGTYRSGDYWLIPARTATGDILWPTETGPDGTTTARAMAPHGIEHHYAPLGHIALDDDGTVTCVDDHDCRCLFDPFCAAAAAESHHGMDHPVSEERVRTLTRIAGVGESRAVLLVRSGRDSASAVAGMSVAEIRRVLTVNEALARSIRESATRIATEEP